ncbi:MAG: DUF2202 domain-containing protein [Candidatus Altiarchaeota archaeon]
MMRWRGVNHIILTAIAASILATGCITTQTTDRLSQGDIAAMHEAINDEYRLKASYDSIFNDYGRLTPFTNLHSAEQEHVADLANLFEKYRLRVPKDNWSKSGIRYSSIEEACVAGVEAERQNAAMYDRLIPNVEDPDVRHVFAKLRDASREYHLPELERCVRRERIRPADLT